MQTKLTQELDDPNVIYGQGNGQATAEDTNQEPNHKVEQIDVDLELEEVKAKEDKAERLSTLELNPLLNDDPPDKWHRPYIKLPENEKLRKKIF